jgi:hypothetical protein
MLIRMQVAGLLVLVGALLTPAVATPARSAAAPTVQLTGGGQAASGKSLPFAATTNAKLGTRYAVELRGVDLKRKPRSSFVQPDYRDPRTCKAPPCRWGVTSQVPIDYEFRAFLVDTRNGVASAASAGIRGIWSSGPQPHAFKFFVNGKSMRLNALNSVDEYVPTRVGKLQVEARWTTDAAATAFSVVIATTEPQAFTYATCTKGTSCRVRARPSIKKDQEMSWTINVVTKKGRQLVIGYQVCLVGRS